MNAMTFAPRWTAQRKAQLVRDFSTGLLTAQEAERNHGMSADELQALVTRYARQGEDGLKVKRIQAEARV